MASSWHPVIHFVGKLRRLDWLLLGLHLLLLAAGCLFIYGTGQQTGGDFSGYWLRQLCWIGLGSVLFIGVVLIPYPILGRCAPAAYLLGIVLLVVVLALGQEINNARSWIHIAGMTLQPAELAKPATLLTVAYLASRRLMRMDPLFALIAVALATAPPILLIAMQPDWGTALVFLPISLSILLVGGMPRRWILAGVVLALMAAPLLYKFALAPHQRDRINTFITPSQDISDAGWNAHQSLLAVGSGGFWGKGFMKGTQNILGFLPRTVAPTDFIFSVVGEETGFVGASTILGAFLGILLCCLRIAKNASDRFGTYLAVGVAAMLFTHVAINIGMTVQAAPIIGIPLPFVSYGGSFLLGSMICMALVQNVHVHRQDEAP